MLIDKIRNFFNKPSEFVKFRDPLGNFEIFYPKNWKFDRDIAVDDSKYAVSFESGSKRVTVFVDFRLPEKFNFRNYVKKEFEGPSSGIISNMKKTTFRGMPAYSRDYLYISSGNKYMSKGIIFYTGNKVYQIAWFGPSDFPEEIFEHMKKSLMVRP
ncbi:hypothetical protein JXA56_04475 [Candidatus Micrarchaeota archaeon]|nr:hypothetical protein [Candidatus Micrarchaeota archaeon]